MHASLEVRPYRKIECKQDAHDIGVGLFQPLALGFELLQVAFACFDGEHQHPEGGGEGFFLLLREHVLCEELL